MADGNTAGSGSQTLSRGIRILEALSAHDSAMTVAELTEELELHRSIVYRLLRTLESHRLVGRDDLGRYALGPRLATLAAGIERDLQQAAMPAMRTVADELAVTCFLVIFDRDSVTTLSSAAPHRSIVAVAQNPGTSHPLGIGAPGRAILGQIPRTSWPADLPAEMGELTTKARTDGYAVSHDEVVPGLHSVAVPLPLSDHPPLALGVVCLAPPRPDAEIAARLQQAAREIIVMLED